MVFFQLDKRIEANFLAVKGEVFLKSVIAKQVGDILRVTILDNYSKSYHLYLTLGCVFVKHM